MNPLSFRPGLLQATLSLLAAVAVTAFVASASPISSEIGGRLAVASAVFFVVALAYGSARFVGLSSIPMLSAALAASAASDAVWVRSIFIGCLWYVAVELAWESIDRRDRGVPDTAVSRRRVNEVATVATLTLGVSTVGFIAAEVAPQRTLLTQGPIVLGLLAAILLMTRTLTGSLNDDGSTQAPS